MQGEDRTLCPVPFPSLPVFTHVVSPLRSCAGSSVMHFIPHCIAAPWVASRATVLTHVHTFECSERRRFCGSDLTPRRVNSGGNQRVDPTIYQKRCSSLVVVAPNIHTDATRTNTKVLSIVIVQPVGQVYVPDQCARASSRGQI